MGDKIHNIRPFPFSFLSGLLGVFLALFPLLFLNSLFLFPALLISYFWITPLLFVNLVHGHFYSSLASGIFLILYGFFVGFLSALTLFCIQLAPCLFLMHLIKNRSLAFYGAGKIFSSLCMAYVFTMVMVISFILDISFLDEMTKEFTTILSSHNIPSVTDSFVFFLPSLLSICCLILLIINIYASLFFFNKAFNRRISFSFIKKEGQIPSYWDLFFWFGLFLILINYGISSFIGKNILLLSCLPLYLYGISIICNWGNGAENSHLRLFFCLMFSVLFVWPAVFIVLLGISGPILSIKKRSDKNA